MEQPKKNLDFYKRLPYALRVEQCKDAGIPRYFLAAFEELQGCKTEGTSEVDAINNLYELFDEYIQTRIENGLSIPEPAVVKIVPSVINAKIVIRKSPIIIKDETIADSDHTINLAKELFFNSEVNSQELQTA